MQKDIATALPGIDYMDLLGDINTEAAMEETQKHFLTSKVHLATLEETNINFWIFERTLCE